MNWIHELSQNKSLQNTLTIFLNQHGISGLENALRLYSMLQQDYVCKTKTSIPKFKIADIYYLEIRTHTITAYTQHDTYQKYGSLTEEQKRLSPYDFIKCNQGCIVFLKKSKAFAIIP